MNTAAAMVALALASAALSAEAAPAKARKAAGSIRGVVRFEGTPPPRPPLARETDPVCAKTARLAEDVVVTDGALRDVLVRVKVGTAGKHAPPKAPVVITQTECMYTPRVVGVVAGQDLRVKNGDPTFHNVRGAVGARTLWNRSQPAGDQDILQRVPDQAGEVVALHCDVHPWMKAFAVVSDHPFFAVTGDDGAFAISGLAPGTYELEAWHATLGTKTAKVTVGKKAASVTFAFGP